MSNRQSVNLWSSGKIGDRNASASCFRVTGVRALGGLWVTGDFASAEHAAASSFKEALAGMDSLRDPDRFGAWLRTIVVRKARLGSSLRQTAVDGLAGTLPDGGPRPDAIFEHLELGAVIQEALRTSHRKSPFRLLQRAIRPVMAVLTRILFS